MKGNFAMFLFLMLCIVFIIYSNIEQNFGHAWFLGPHTLGKSVFLTIYGMTKQNLDHVWLLRPYTLGKLVSLLICLSIKQNLGHT